MQTKFYLSILLILNLLIPNTNLIAQSLPVYQSYSERQFSPGKTTYFIDPKYGNDHNKGTSRTKPWKTFSQINRLVLSAGDVLDISPGVFKESLVLLAQGTKALPVSVKFRPGKYDLFPDHALKKEMQISNTNDRPHDQKTIALMFDSCKFTSIKGSNSKLKLHGKMIETYINNCTDITLDGLSYDYNRPTVSELKVINEKPHSVDLKIHKDSKFSIKDSMLIWQGEGWNYPIGRYWQTLDVNTNTLQRAEIAMKDVRFVSIDSNMVRAYFNHNPGFKNGLIYQNRDIIRDCAGVFMQRSKNVQFKNIRIYYMHGMGVVVQNCENIKISHVTVKPDELSGRTCAAWADILHFSGCKGKIEISNSYLSAANDDAINVHGIHLKIKKIESPDQIVVEFMHDQTFGFNPYLIGDSIDFIRPQSLLPIGESNSILNATMFNDKEILLKLKYSLPPNVSTNDVVENTTGTPEVWIHDNQITRIPTRGILTTSRRKIIIEHNDIRHTHMSGILVNDDAGYWFESGMVRNLTVNRNNFYNCGEPVIDIHPENTVASKIAVHKNISIINNTFNLQGRSLFSAKSTSNLKIKGNTIKMSKPTKIIDDLLQLKDCTKIDISNNLVISAP